MTKPVPWLRYYSLSTHWSTYLKAVILPSPQVCSTEERGQVLMCLVFAKKQAPILTIPHNAVPSISSNINSQIFPSTTILLHCSIGLFITGLCFKSQHNRKPAEGSTSQHRKRKQLDSEVHVNRSSRLGAELGNQAPFELN